MAAAAAAAAVLQRSLLMPDKPIGLHLLLAEGCAHTHSNFKTLTLELKKWKKNRERVKEKERERERERKRGQPSTGCYRIFAANVSCSEVFFSPLTFPPPFFPFESIFLR